MPVAARTGRFGIHSAARLAGMPAAGLPQDNTSPEVARQLAQLDPQRQYHRPRLL